MVGISSNLFAQNCEAIVAPYLSINGIDRSEYPEPKFEWRCKFSRSAFYVCDSVPANATVIPITELTNLLTGNHVQDHFVIDLNTLSYWGYDFVNFHKVDYFNTIYFDTHNATNRYLAMRDAREIYRRANAEEKE